jgi:phosphoesterase RecJ-like protein
MYGVIPMEIIDIINNHQRFILAGHVGPDGDSIGSCMGFALALAKMGKEPIVVLDDFPEKFNIIPGGHFIWKENLNKLEAEVFFALDCADMERLGPAKPLFKKTRITICIDHHETNKGFALHNLIDVHASSTSEIIFNLISPLVEIDKDIASAIYAGMVTDTGGFRYSATGKNTLDNAARMLDLGIPFTEIYSELMNKQSFIAAKALGVAIENMQQAMDGRIVYSYATREELAKVGAKPSDLDRTAEYLMNTRGAEVALFVYEKESPPEVKVSVRSLNLHIGLFAARWGGGGHQLAAGCTVKKPVAEILPELLAALEEELSAGV